MAGPSCYDPGMTLALVLLAQSEGPGPIRPTGAELVWNVVSIALVLATAVLAVLLVRTVLTMRRTAERTASGVALLLQEQRQRHGRASDEVARPTD